MYDFFSSKNIFLVYVCVGDMLIKKKEFLNIDRKVFVFDYMKGNEFVCSKVKFSRKIMVYILY